jgi:hypothetical protein
LRRKSGSQRAETAEQEPPRLTAPIRFRIDEVEPSSDDDSYGLQFNLKTGNGGALREEDLRELLGAASARLF